MAYQPIPVRPAPRNVRNYTTTMANKGMNLRTAPQFLKPDQAQLIENYLTDDIGSLIKREGLELLLDESGTDSITMLKKMTSDIYIYAFADKLKAYTKSTSTKTAIHTFTGTGDAVGTVVGGYFLVCNGTEKIAAFSTALNDYAVLTDANAPLATVLFAFEGRLFAGINNRIHWSEVDAGTGIPFDGADDWTYTVNTDTAVDKAQAAEFRNAGTIKSIGSIGSQIVGLYDDGKAGFKIGSLDVGGTITQDTTLDFQRIDFGSEQGSVGTPDGLFYANEYGLWQLVSGGITNVPGSEQEGQPTLILGKDYFDDATITDCDIAYYAKENTVLFTFAQDSSINNEILAYNLDTKAVTKITGWTISRFMVDGGDIYGGGDGTTKVWQLFIGDDDDGVDIYCRYEQEINAGDLHTRKSLEELWVDGSLSPSTEITIAFDIYDRNGVFVPNKKQATWTPDGIGSGGGAGYGEEGWGEMGYGGRTGGTDLIHSFDGAKGLVKINNFQRLILKLNENSQVPHRVAWTKLDIREKNPIRIRNL